MEWPSGPLPSLFKWWPLNIKWANARVSWIRTIEIHRKIFKNLLLQNHLAQVLEIWYAAWPSVHAIVPVSEMAPCQEDPVFEPKKYIKKYSKIFFRTTGLSGLNFGMLHGLVVHYKICSNGGPWAKLQVLGLWCVAWHSGPLPSLFKCRFNGLK